MAGIHVPFDRSTLRRPRMHGRQSRNPISSPWLRKHWDQLSPVASVLGMVGYFLLLGSVAVIVITGQFPWFTVAPVTILLSVAYFRYVEAKEARRWAQRHPGN